MALLARVNLVFLFLLLQACNRGPGDGPRPLVIANSAEASTLDLHQATGQPELRVIGALFEGLVIRGLHGPEVRPGIAHSWDVSPNGKIYTFHLRESKWSDGSTLTSRDFLRSWRRFANPLTASEYSSLLKIIRNGNSVRDKSMPPDSLGVSAPDDSTFVVNLEFPVGLLLEVCAFEPFFPV